METQRSSVFLYGALGILVVLALFARLSSSSDPESNWLQDVLPSDESTTSLEFKRNSDSSRQQSTLTIRNQQIAQLKDQLSQNNEELRSALRELSKKIIQYDSVNARLTGS